MRSKADRPATANTMVLVLKPREEEYKNMGLVSGSEKEREAWRKNKVIQMKLGSYLAEVRLQQKSSTRLLKTEEYRFLQEVARRSSVPRSVMMLEELQLYKEKTFPDASYNYSKTFTPSVRGGYSSHKHPPLSARGPLRTRSHQTLLNRPQTSASVFRKKDVDAGVYHDFDSKQDNTDLLIDRVRDFQEEIIYSLGNRGNTFPGSVQKQNTDLPSITCKETITSKENKENITRDILLECGSLAREPIPPKINGISELQGVSGLSLDRSYSSVKFSNPLKQKRESFDRSASLSKMPSMSKFSSKDLPISEEQQMRAYSEDSFEGDEKLEELLAEEIKAFDMEEAALNTNLTGDNALLVDVFGKDEGTDETLGIIDLDDGYPKVDSTTHVVKKNLKPKSKQTSFNRLKSEPVMPLRHNITSVLRQERTRYEASQNKIKNYLHKLTPRDILTPGNNKKETNTPLSRRSSAKK